MKATHRISKAFPAGYEGKIFVGIDTHKKSYHVCLWGMPDNRKLLSWVQPPDPQALMAKLEPLRSQVQLIVYEAGPFGFGLARDLISENWPAIVASPNDIPTAPNAPKSDARDAQNLARLLAHGALHPIHIPTEMEETHRALQRQRQQALKDKQCQMLRLGSYLLSLDIRVKISWSARKLPLLIELTQNPFQQTLIQNYIIAYQQAVELVKNLDAQLRELARHPDHEADVNYLQSIPGIGLPTALQFALEMGNPQRFETRRQVAKYQGLAPDVRSSGETRRQGPLNRSGNRRLKTLLIEAAWRWQRYDPQARQYYHHYFSNTGCKQKAITALAHKLGTIMWALMRDQVFYEPTRLHAPRPRCAA